MTQPAARRAHLERLNAAAAADSREHAESLLRGIDALTRRFALIEHVPLDVLDRAERILVTWHVSNLMRLPSYSAGDYEEAER